MTTKFVQGSAIYATSHMSPMGPVVTIVTGEESLSMAPEKAADFAASLILKSAEALALWSEQSSKSDET